MAHQSVTVTVSAGGGSVTHSWADTAKIVQTMNRGGVAAASLQAGDVIELPPDGTPVTLVSVVVNEHEESP